VNQSPRTNVVERQRHDTPMSSHAYGSMHYLPDEKAASPPNLQPVSRNAIQRRDSAEDITALPVNRERNQSPRLQNNATQGISRITQPNTPVRFANLPSTKSRNSLSNAGTPGRTSSKRRHGEHLREEQIRAMSASPVIMGHAGGSSSGVHRVQSKRTFDSEGKGLRGSQSNVSLHKADSILSSYTVPQDRRRWDLGVVDRLSPHPTIRHSFRQLVDSSALGPNPSFGSPSALGSRPVTREDIDDRETIAQLADDLDSNTIRQLMERDQRRRERKRLQEEDKARRRLERHAARRTAESSPLARKRTRSGTRTNQEREDPSMIGLAVSNQAGPSKVSRHPVYVQPAVVPHPLRSVESSVRLSVDSARVPIVTVRAGASAEGMSQVLSASAALIPIIFKNPRVSSTDGDVRLSQTSLSSTYEAPITYARQAPQFSQVTAIDDRRPSSSQRRTSGASTKPVGPLTALFQRTRATSRSVLPESSFSNTSRESMSKQPIPLHLRDSPQPSRPLSTAPSRAGTRSKFHEDLPESPSSLPDLRLHSPIDSRTALTELPESATYSLRQLEKMPETSGTLPRDIPSRDGVRKASFPAMPPPPPVLVSQSLASIDSEASWLSGKPPKRPSVSESVPQNSIKERSGAFNGSYENLGITDEEYFKKLNPTSNATSEGDITRTALADSDEEVSPGGESLHTRSGTHIVKGDIARAPTLVNRPIRVQSNQGILNQFGVELPSSPAGEYDTEYESSTSSPNRTQSSPANEHTNEARSVPMFAIQHARQGSRGSARLLDIPARKDSLRSSLVVGDGPNRLGSNRGSAVKLDAMNDKGSNRSSTVGIDVKQNSTIMEHAPHNSSSTV